MEHTVCVMKIENGPCQTVIQFVLNKNTWNYVTVC